MRSLPPDGGVAGIDAVPPDNNNSENEQQQPLVQNCFACSKTEDLTLSVVTKRKSKLSLQ